MDDTNINKKVLLVIAPRDFKDVEYSSTRKKLEESGIQVEVASIQTGTAVGADGMEVEVEKQVSEVDPNDYSGVAFIGGPGMAQIVGDDSLQNTARRFYESQKITGAICIAPVILAKAGLLEDKRATVFSDGREELEKGGADLRDRSTVVDGRLVTGRGPEAAKEFGAVLAEELKK